uniref:p0035H10.16 protein n=1 Tax=Oryza sativa subsp. japonica TaxID=39947 RepID=Q9FP27_ORYSJ|nr:P0035H10.16 [Oryza sativa Japonica Group]
MGAKTELHLKDLEQLGNFMIKATHWLRCPPIELLHRHDPRAKKEKTELHQKDLEQLGNYMIKGGGHGSKE